MIDHSQWLDSIVRASWQGALLVLAAWVALRLLKTAPARFRSWIWPIVLTKFVLVALFVWELPVLAPSEAVHGSEPLWVFAGADTGRRLSPPQPAHLLVGEALSNPQNLQISVSSFARVQS